MIQKISSDLFRVAFRLGRLFFPADLLDFANIISRHGYSILAQIGPKRAYPTSQLGGALDPLAQKQNMLLDINTEKQVIGITGPVLIDLFKTMNEMVMIMNENFYIEKKDFMFFELQGSMYKITKSNPLGLMTKVSKKASFLKLFSERLNSDVALRSIRISPSGLSPHDLDYFDIVIEPSLASPNKILQISIMYRQKDLDILSKRTSRIDSVINELIGSLERP
jgi:hypothetical protein